MSKLLMAKHALLRRQQAGRLRAAWCCLSWVSSQRPPTHTTMRLSSLLGSIDRQIPPAPSAPGCVPTS